MKLVEEIPLSDHLTLEMWDESRSIAADITKVELYIRMKVDLSPSYFIKPEHYEMVKKVFGPQIFFQNRMERTFVDNHEKDEVFQKLLALLKKTSSPTYPNRHSLALLPFPSTGISKKTAINIYRSFKTALPECL
jgi:hypothetical protein